jgi:hypothetical protein
MKPIWLRISYLVLGLAFGLLLSSNIILRAIWPWEILYRSVYTTYYAYLAGCVENQPKPPSLKYYDYCVSRAALRAKDLLSIYDRYENGK